MMILLNKVINLTGKETLPELKEIQKKISIMFSSALDSELFILYNQVLELIKNLENLEINKKK